MTWKASEKCPSVLQVLNISPYTLQLTYQDSSVFLIQVKYPQCFSSIWNTGDINRRGCSNPQYSCLAL